MPSFRQRHAAVADKISMASVSDTPMRILLVDDDSRLRELTSRRLASESYEVTVAVDGEDAWEKAQARPPDIIVSDIVMPRLDGLGLLDRLRRHPQLRECYVLLLTAKDRAEDITAGFAAMANDYITKPFRMAELVARVHAGARLKRVESELRQANQQLREALQQRAELLGIAAHEIRNPLNIITTYLSLLGKGIVDDQAIREVCLRRAKDLAVLIDSLLDAAKIDAGQVTLRPEEQNLVSLLRDTYDLFAPVARERELHMSLAAPQRLMVVADRMRLAEALHILFGNAIALSRPRGELAVAGRLTAEGEVEAFLRFQPDNLPPEAAPLLYETPTESRASLAAVTISQRLGFSIVRKLVSMMGGECLAAANGAEIEIGFRFPRLLTAAEERARRRYDICTDQTPT